MGTSNSGRWQQLIASSILCFAILAASGVARACNCALRTCIPERYGDVAFVGDVVSSKVISVEEKLGNGAFSRRMMVYQIRVTESFRGSQKIGDVVSVQTGTGGGDCGYPFAIGRKYLVDARTIQGVAHTGICNATAPVDQSEPALGILRKMAAHQPLPALVGLVDIYTGLPGEPPQPKPVAGIPVELKSVVGGQPWTSTTDAAGAVWFSDVPAGSYLFSVSLPPNLTLDGTDWGPYSEGLLAPIKIERSPGMVCRAEIELAPSGSISGTVKSVGQFKGTVIANLPNPDGTSSHFYDTAHLDPDGNFKFKHLKGGRYLVHFETKEDFVGRRNLNIEGAQVIQLGDGEQKTGLVLIAK